MKGWIWALIGAGGAAAVVTGIGVAEHYAHAKSSGGGGGGGGGTTAIGTLKSGHRYALSVSCPATTTLPLPSPTLPPPALFGAVATMLGVSPIAIVSYTALPAGNGFSVTFDYTGAADLPLPAMTAAAACQAQLTDQGLTSQIIKNVHPPV